MELVWDADQQPTPLPWGERWLTGHPVDVCGACLTDVKPGYGIHRLYRVGELVHEFGRGEAWEVTLDDGDPTVVGLCSRCAWVIEYDLADPSTLLADVPDPWPWVRLDWLPEHVRIARSGGMTLEEARRFNWADHAAVNTLTVKARRAAKS